MLLWTEVSWNPLAFFVNETWLEQHVSAMETFSADRDDVSVWKHAGLLLVNFRSRLELCVATNTGVAQLLFDIPSYLPLPGGSEGVHTSSLGRHVRGGHVERLKPGLRHALSVCLGVQKSFRG